MARYIAVCRALFSFPGEEAGDLPFEEDDIIRVIKKDESGWWYGQHDNGRKGEFPGTYVEIIQEEMAQRIRTTRRFNNSAPQTTAPSDKLQSIKVSCQRGQPVFNVEARTTKKSISNVKSMDDFRQLHETLKFLFPQYDRPLPPFWADKLYENDQLSNKKAAVLEAYLKRMMIVTNIGNELTEFALVNWLKPGENFNTTDTIRNQVQHAVSNRARINFANAQVVLARAAYPWEQKDAVELSLYVGAVVAVRNKNTQNEGWWEGEDSSGQRGLFPNNYVKILSPGEVQSVIRGQAKPKSPAPVPRQTFTKPVTQVAATPMSPTMSGRDRKTISNFAIPNLDAFDELLNDGFTMLDRDSVLTKRPNAKVPKKGDTVTLSYVAYVWDCQNQKLIEFGSSDLPDGDKQVGPKVFTVGDGQEIVALDRAVQSLEQGQHSRIIVTPDLGYGEVGSPPKVPPNCHLVYDVTLDGFQSGGGGMARAKPVSTGFVQNRPKRQVQAYATQQSHHQFQEGETRKYDLHRLREIVRLKNFKQHGVDAAFVEYHLYDEEFPNAFNMSKKEFMLQPKWKRSRMKQMAQLY